MVPAPPAPVDAPRVSVEVPPPGRPRRLRAALVTVSRLALGALILWLVFREANPWEAIERARAAPTWVFVLPAVLLFFNSCVHAVRLRLLLPPPDPAAGVPAAPFPGVLRSVLLGNFVGLILPTGGGEAVKVLALSRLTGDFETALATLGLSRVLELGPWGLLLFWGAFDVLPERLPAYVGPTVLGGVTMLAVFGLALTTLRWPDRVLAVVPAWAGRARLVRLAGVRAPWPRVLACGLLAIPFALVNCFVVYAILHGFGAALPYRDVLGLIPTLDVIISLPITISGLGVREEMFVRGLAAWNIDPATALAVASTRWSGELFRSLLGGALWALSRGDEGDSGSSPNRHATVGPVR